MSILGTATGRGVLIAVHRQRDARPRSWSVGLRLIAGSIPAGFWRVCRNLFARQRSGSMLIAYRAV
jgi:hypothetical protein